jgi:redox-sensitive bicupin YhaK (pirin superfamily)
MNNILHPSSERGHFDFGWLKTWHSFSFGHFYNKQKMHFGTLRVLNEDIVAPDTGFDLHPHKNMEIITFILDGELQHTDSMGNKGIIRREEVQVMTAGSGIFHSETNPSKQHPCHLLQIWILPEKENLTPRYDQKKFHENEFRNTLKKIVGRVGSDAPLGIHQDAAIYVGYFSQNTSAEISKKDHQRGFYLFVINGDLTANEMKLSKGDALGIWNENKLKLHFTSDAKILVFEVGEIS